MVSFSCEGCGDVLTKKKLDPHRNQCRGASYTCLDCMTHFANLEYRSHTSCISEAQKYQGKLYKEKPTKVKKSQSAQQQDYGGNNNNNNNNNNNESGVAAASNGVVEAPRDKKRKRGAIAADTDTADRSESQPPTNQTEASSAKPTKRSKKPKVDEHVTETRVASKTGPEDENDPDQNERRDGESPAALFMAILGKRLDKKPSSMHSVFKRFSKVGKDDDAKKVLETGCAQLWRELKVRRDAEGQIILFV